MNTSFCHKMGTDFGKSLVSLIAAAHVFSGTDGATLAKNANGNENPLEPSTKSPNSEQPLFGPKTAATVHLSVTNQVTTDSFAVLADVKELPFPLEKKLRLKRPLQSGLVSTNEFRKIEGALVGQFRAYLQAIGTHASLEAYEKEINKKPDKLKVGRRGLDWLFHWGKKKTVKNLGKIQVLADVNRDQAKVKKDLTRLKSWTLNDVTLQEVKAITPLRTVVREDAGRFVSLYQVSTEKDGIRFGVIADDIPLEQTELRRVLLEDRAFLKRGPVDFAGFADEGHDHLADAILFSLGVLDSTRSSNEKLKPLRTTPAASVANYIERDVAAVASARKKGSAAGMKNGKGVKFKAQPGDWFIGLEGGMEDGESNVRIIYQEGKVGIKIGASPKNIYVSPQVTMPGGGNTLSFRLPVYEFSKSSARAEQSRARTNLSIGSERMPQGRTDIAAETKRESSEAAEKNAGPTFDESQDRLFAAKWRKDPALLALLDKRGYKMQGIFDGGLPFTAFPLHGFPVYFDEYSMIIDKAPNVNSGEPLLSFLLKDPSGFVNRADFDALSFFKPERQRGTPTVGDIYHIDIFGPDNGSVVLVERAENYFIFQTVKTDKTGGHPENGAREFGFENLPDGSIKFYTRAAASSGDLLSETFGPPFQRWAWEKLLDGVKEKIEFFGGKVRKGSETRRFELLEPENDVKQ